VRIIEFHRVGFSFLVLRYLFNSFVYVYLSFRSSHARLNVTFEIDLFLL